MTILHGIQLKNSDDIDCYCQKLELKTQAFVILSQEMANRLS